jgi:pimeloyl-ACP methyl ester carboxylesterase
MGHSAGAGVVQGYAGQFHDVAAVVQADYSNQGRGPVADQRFAAVAAKIAAGDDYPQFFDNQPQCLAFNIYPPGAVPSVVNIACNPNNFVRTPAGEFIGFAALLQVNNTYVPRTGNTPVLLGYADHDAVFPPAAANADEYYWRTTCVGCDITRLDQVDSAHLFQAHRVMPQWVGGVVNWLKSKGIGP